MLALFSQSIKGELELLNQLKRRPANAGTAIHQSKDETPEASMHMDGDNSGNLECDGSE